MQIQKRNVIAEILRFDAKTTSYKMALIRAINDIVVSSPTITPGTNGVAVPLHKIAELWIAYYWPFVDKNMPIYQGPRNFRDGIRWNDMAFRPEITNLRDEFESIIGPGKPSDGFFLLAEMRIPRRRAGYGKLYEMFVQTARTIEKTVLYPIRYAGPTGSHWTIFPKPFKFLEAEPGYVPLPGTFMTDRCIGISAEMWENFKSLSVWVEALCIHEWSLFSESIFENQSNGINRGAVYTLLTDRPENRRPLTWERNNIDISLMEGNIFECPWTRKKITTPEEYDLDHIIPVAIYPINELWNLVPANPAFNSKVKRDKLPSLQRIESALPALEATYTHYMTSNKLKDAFVNDLHMRFVMPDTTPAIVAESVKTYVCAFTANRNLRTF